MATEHRFMLYAHAGSGLGRFRRNVALSRALLQLDPEANVLLACSGVGLETFALPGGADLLRLPELDRLGDGAHVGLASLRAALLAAAVERFRPHVLVVDQHPLADHEELWPTLRLLREQGGRAAVDLDLGGSRRAAALLLDLAGPPGRPGRPRQPAPEPVRLSSRG